MLSVIIVHYGDVNKTLKCINSVVEKINIPFEILVWDNDEGGSKFKIQSSNFIVLKILRMYKNIGYGAAINKAVKYAKYKYILILNNDTEIIGWLRIGKRHDLEDNCIYGAETYDENGLVNSCHLDLNPIDELFKNLRIRAILDNIKGSKSKVQGSKLHWTYNVGGHFLFMKKELFEKVGGFDEKYFMYAEEFDLCKRARFAGYKIIHNPYFKIKHLKKKGSKFQIQSSVDIVSVRIDSKLYYLKKFYPAVFIFTALANGLVALIYYILCMIFQGSIIKFLSSKFKVQNVKFNEWKYYYLTFLKKVNSYIL